jgi:hypothetical protein
VKTYLSTSREYKTPLSWFDYPTIPFVLIQLCWAGEEPEAEEVENLLQSVEKYTLASHLVWGLWGIISVSSYSGSPTKSLLQSYALLSSNFRCFLYRIVSTTSTSITRSMQGRDSSSTGRRSLQS